MKTSVHYEPYAIYHDVPYPDGDLAVTWSELKEAEVGKTWSVEDQDTYPNRNCSWIASYKVVYKDDDGVLVRAEKDGDGEIELMWFEFRD